MGWLSGYDYRKKVPVNSTVAGAQTNYQMRLIVGEAEGAYQADVHCEGHCPSIPNSVRFTGPDGVTKHKYWMELDAAEGVHRTIYQIAIDSIPASGSVDLYMYYCGSLSDSGESNGDNTFEFFDDFDYSLYTKTWITNSDVHYDCFPAIVKAQNGNLILVYRRGTTHKAQNDGTAMKQISTDMGQTWGASSTLYDDPTYEIADVQIHVAPNGNVIAFVCRQDVTNTIDLGVKYAISTDNGATFGSWSDFPNDGANRTVDFSAHLINVSDIIYGVSFSCTNNGNYSTGSFNNVLWKSEDNGANWTKVASVNGTSDNCNEATITWLTSESRFLVISRDNNSSNTWKRKSTDAAGTTWGSKSNISSQVGVIQDPELGWIGNTLILAGRVDAVRQIVQYFSDDNGTTFIDKSVIENYDVQDNSGGYTSCVVIDGSNALITYYTNVNYGLKPDIRQAFFDVHQVRGNSLGSKWDIEGSPTMDFENSIMTMRCNAEEWLKSKTFTQTPPAVLYARTKDNPFGVRNYPASYGFGDYDWPVDCSGVRRDPHSIDNYCLMVCNGIDRDLTGAIARNANFAVYKIQWETAICHIYEDGVKKDADDVADNIPTGALDVRIGRGSYMNEANDFDVDWIFVCKYASPEPTWGAWGAEEKRKHLLLKLLQRKGLSMRLSQRGNPS